MFVSLRLTKRTVTKSKVNYFELIWCSIDFSPCSDRWERFFFPGGRKVLFLDLRVLVLHRSWGALSLLSLIANYHLCKVGKQRYNICILLTELFENREGKQCISDQTRALKLTPQFNALNYHFCGLKKYLKIPQQKN